MAANRNFASGGKFYSMRVMPVMIDLQISIGATGAVTSTSATSLVKSVTRTSTGLYRINLQNGYNSLLSLIGAVQSPSSGLSGVLCIETQNAATTAITSQSAPGVSIKCLDAAGALVDPASGSTLMIVIMANNSSVKT